MKRLIYALIIPLVVAGGLVFANRKMENEMAKAAPPKPLSAAEMAAERKKWEASPDGVKFKEWEESPAGKKVYAGVANIAKQVREFTDMEGVITSLSLPPGSRLGFGVMARINAVDYILRFDADKTQLEQLKSLKVNDRVTIRSHNVSLAPKYAYPIISGDEMERDGKLVFKRIHPKGGC